MRAKDSRSIFRCLGCESTVKCSHLFEMKTRALEIVRICLDRALGSFLRQVSLRIVITLTSYRPKPFYLIRDMILTTDFLLSFLVRLAGIGLIIRILAWSHPLNPYDAILAALCALSVTLLHYEKKLKMAAALRPFHIENINIGSSRLLKGRVLLGHVFVQRTSGAWDKNKIASTLKKVEQATRWIEKQAQNFKAEVVFDTYLPQTLFVRFGGPIPCHKNRHRNLAAFEEAFRDPVKELTAHAAKTEAQNTALLIHTDENVRSYAVAKWLGDRRPINFMEYCVCSTYYSEAAYAHEILHLFGADDFYSEFFKKLHHYRSEFLRGSIMFSGHSLEGVRIDDLTAQNLGWL